MQNMSRILDALKQLILLTGCRDSGAWSVMGRGDHIGICIYVCDSIYIYLLTHYTYCMHLHTSMYLLYLCIYLYMYT